MQPNGCASSLLHIRVPFTFALRGADNGTTPNCKIFTRTCVLLITTKNKKLFKIDQQGHDESLEIFYVNITNQFILDKAVLSTLAKRGEEYSTITTCRLLTYLCVTWAENKLVSKITQRKHDSSVVIFFTFLEQCGSIYLQAGCLLYTSPSPRD